VNRSAFDRLNTVDPAINGFRPGEAGAAAELEKYLGGTLERSANPSVDFVFTSGKNTGQTVDFLLTPDSFTQAEKINRYFEQNLSGFADTLESHANAADLVPIDTRFLSESNQKLLENVISKLSPEVQAKIILFK
jgi:filamentous hemagglutinin